MSVERYSAENAPGFAKHSSSFKNDDRCYEVDFVIGDSWTQVWEATAESFNEGGYSDLDVGWSTEGGKYVGVTCKDHDEQTS